jgi:mannosyl-3-phosphoglycerate phosphatase
VLFTDLDGTLLDCDTYQPSVEAMSVLARLAAQGVMTVPVTSKTAVEVEHLAAIVDLSHVAVVEGGAVLWTPGGRVRRRLLGPSRTTLCAILASLRSTGWPVRGMAEMTVAEVCSLTGLEADGARRAMTREASEPFLLIEPLHTPVAGLQAAVAELGGGLTRGGRFFHLAGRGIDKGHAIGTMLALCGSLSGLPAGAVGDAWNDLPMLARVDFGFLLGDAVADHEVPPGVVRLRARGPAGFVDAAARFMEHLHALEGDGTESGGG